MAKKLVFWRHGQTDFNLDGKIQGQIDVPLNQTGMEQAWAAAQELLQYQPELVICSDLGRAQQTAAALAEQAGVSVQVDERLRERAFGKFEGLNARELKQQYETSFTQWRETGECAVAGVESRSSVGLRVAESVLEWAERINGTLVVVSHGSALTQGLVEILGLDPLAWQGVRGLDNAHWSVLVPSRRQPAWRLHSHNLGAPSSLG